MERIHGFEAVGSLTHDEEANERHKGVGVALPVDVDHQINIANAVGKFIDGLPVSGREHSPGKLVVDEEDNATATPLRRTSVAVREAAPKRSKIIERQTVGSSEARMSSSTLKAAERRDFHGGGSSI